jgi:hypothetical protein
MAGRSRDTFISFDDARPGELFLVVDGRRPGPPPVPTTQLPVAQPLTLDEVALGDYLGELRHLGRNRRTVLACSKSLRHLRRWSPVPVFDLSADEVEGWAICRVAEAGVVTSGHDRLVALHFLEWAKLRGWTNRAAVGERAVIFDDGAAPSPGIALDAVLAASELDL